MADNIADQNTKHPESPTTAKEPDFDDEPQETGVIGISAAPQPAPKRVNFQEDAPPPKPPRPQSPNAQAEATLVEAFPSIDAKVVRAVLVASGGQVEPAFNALLGMSDPSFQDEQPPQMPPRRTDSRHPPPGVGKSQIEQDELFARQLADHYETSAYGYGSRGAGNPPLPQRRKETGLKPNELYDGREHSFIDDDLPAIRDSVIKGFQETRDTVNKWFIDVRKRIDGDSDDELSSPPGPAGQRRQNFGPSQSAQMHGIQKNADRARRSGDRERYDADPRVLGDDFTQLELHDNEAPAQQRRPLANPDLFKPLPTGPTPQTGPVDEIDALYRARTPTEQQRQPSPSAGKGGKKWQPLTSIAPAPEGEDHDPFSLGDSDEEQDKKQDLRPEDSDRLKKVASEVEGASAAGGEKVELKEAERSGSIGQKDKTAEDLLAGKK